MCFVSIMPGLYYNLDQKLFSQKWTSSRTGSFQARSGCSGLIKADKNDFLMPQLVSCSQARSFLPYLFTRWCLFDSFGRLRSLV
jgi:hypothetical protein